MAPQGWYGLAFFVGGLLGVIFNRQWARYGGEWLVGPRPPWAADEWYEYRRRGMVVGGAVSTIVGLAQVLHYGFHIL